MAPGRQSCVRHIPALVGLGLFIKHHQSQLVPHAESRAPAPLHANAATAHAPATPGEVPRFPMVSGSGRQVAEQIDRAVLGFGLVKTCF